MEAKNRFEIRIRELEMTNFRQFEELKINFDQQITVLIGKNRSGKTTVLDALAGCLSFLVAQILRTPIEKSFLTESDIRNGSVEAVNTIVVEFEEVFQVEKKEEKNQPIEPDTIALSWYTSLTAEGFDSEEITDSQSMGQLSSLASAAFNQVKRNEPASLPVLVYYRCDYGTDLSESPSKGTPMATGTNMAHGYDKAFSPQAFDFRQFFEWYKWRERITVQTGSDSLKENVERAVLSLLSDDDGEYQNLHTDYLRSPQGVLKVYKAGEEISVNQFSSGEKLLFALTANLAWRLSVLNPGIENPLESNGIVLIDEIELHLHPAWQRKIVPKLMEIFPNVQFIISTHSPVILGQIASRHIRILENGEVYSATDTLGQDVATILKDVMDTPSKDHETEIAQIFRYLALDQLNNAEQLIAKVEIRVEGLLPELLQAKAILDRKKITMAK